MAKSVNGTSAQTLGELPVEVDYTYRPGSPGTRLDPPDPEELEIHGIRHGEYSIDPSEVSETVLARWEERIREAVADALPAYPEDD